MRNVRSDDDDDDGDEACAMWLLVLSPPSLHLLFEMCMCTFSCRMVVAAVLIIIIWVARYANFMLSMNIHA